MTKEEIRQKAIECGENFGTMCASNIAFDDNLSAKCADNCEYIDTGVEQCSAVYAYEHGFADGVEEGKQKALADLAENLEQEIANLNRAEWTERNLACFVFRIQEIIEQMKGETT